MARTCALAHQNWPDRAGGRVGSASPRPDYHARGPAQTTGDLPTTFRHRRREAQRFPHGYSCSDPPPQFDDAFVPPKVGAHSLTTSERLSAACSIASFHRNAATILPTLGIFYSTGIGSKRLTRGLARSRMTTIDIRLPLAFEILENQLVECPSCATTVCTM